jgi:translation initiation factor 2B subunit (eIF-2B alpha/beta/delta family)
MERPTATLRELLGSVSSCAERFEEAEQLSLCLFNGDKGRVILPFFTDHTREHCEHVERHLDALVFGGGRLAESDFVPTAEEAMYLLAAAWLHDLGMIYGILEGEQPSDLRDSPGRRKHHRDMHDQRTTTFILERWKLNCNWDRRERVYLANICQYHRRHHPIDEFSPAETGGRCCDAPVRLRVLAALLRLADACHVGQSRAPGPLRGLYDALGMPPDSVCHWETADLITEVRFDHAQKRIALVAEVPPPLDFEMGRFDLRELIHKVTKSVQEELLSVQAILSKYPNLAFQEADHNIHLIEALSVENPRRCLALWPYLLHERARTATEAASAVVQLLFLTAKTMPDFEAASRETVEGILDEALRSRPFDFMMRNLSRNVRAIVSDASSTPKVITERLVTYLSDFRDCIAERSSEMAREAAALVNPGDVLIVYGYSTNVVKFLENSRRTRNVPLYVVDCYRPGDAADADLEENRRIAVLARELGLQVCFVGLAGLSQVLADLNQRGTACKVLLGTHGVLRGNDLLCKVGTYSLVLTARAFDATVIAFADPEKFLATGERDEELASSQKILQRGSLRPHPGVTSIPCMLPAIDRIPRGLVHHVVGEAFAGVTGTVGAQSGAEQSYGTAKSASNPT